MLSASLDIFIYINSIDILVRIEAVDSTFRISWKWQTRFSIKPRKLLLCVNPISFATFFLANLNNKIAWVVSIFKMEIHFKGRKEQRKFVTSLPVACLGVRKCSFVLPPPTPHTLTSPPPTLPRQNVSTKG